MLFTAAGTMTRAMFLTAYFLLREIIILSLSLFEWTQYTPFLSITIPCILWRGLRFSYFISMFKGLDYKVSLSSGYVPECLHHVMCQKTGKSFPPNFGTSHMWKSCPYYRNERFTVLARKWRIQCGSIFVTVLEWPKLSIKSWYLMRDITSGRYTFWRIYSSDIYLGANLFDV